MLATATIEPVAAIHTEARLMRDRPVPARLWRSLADRWLHNQEERWALQGHCLDHPGMQDDSALR